MNINGIKKYKPKIQKCKFLAGAEGWGAGRRSGRGRLEGGVGAGGGGGSGRGRLERAKRRGFLAGEVAFCAGDVAKIHRQRPTASRVH